MSGSEFNKVIIFDCDGTLADGQHMITDSMNLCLDRFGMERLDHADVRRIIGLSLMEAFQVLKPELSTDDHAALTEGYKKAFFDLRSSEDFTAEPLYPDTIEVLKELDGKGYCLAVATGKSLRGLRRVLSQHDILDMFVSLQTSDHHPSKPHPSMVQTAILDAGSHPDQAIVIGDTSYDMQMAKSAGAHALGVSWGYHEVPELVNAGATKVAHSFREIPAMVSDLMA
ncbi:hydrolase [Kordiimonas sediminis]|uniref:Hydrolase n=1 Tax=Kordiimonas sediminis TaxID=1735581 RepID=A0A919AUV0_9PROT|nr:HAD-IA family hydrolase [Kordiimonas sediminis]GHF24615.1 hydrolase [Kordiimonas sediminis]